MLLFRKKTLAYVTHFISILLIGSGYATNSNDIKKLFSIHYDSSIPRSNIAVIIPGMNQTYADPGYDSVGYYFKSRGIIPVYVNINWKAFGLNDLSTTVLEIDTMLMDSFPDSHVFLFGFSLGAVISLKLSQLLHAEHVLLCSMSPAFAEDRTYQAFPFKQLMSLFTGNVLNGLSYSSSLKECVYFFYGDHDSFLINSAIIRNRKVSFKCNETIIVKNARHNISDKQYLRAIDKILQKIN